MSRVVPRFVAPLFAVVLLLLTVPAALAHASLVESDPVAGASITTPYVVVLRFDEELKPIDSSVVVRDASGTAVGDGTTVEDNFTMAVELPQLPLGAYTAHWIAITADDNGKTQGDVTFNVVAATPPPTASPLATPPPVTPAGTVPASATPTVAVATPVPTVTPGPTPDTSVPNQAAGAELIVPLVLAGAVVVALAWFFLRRRPT
jgi:copper resistance protein C